MLTSTILAALGGVCLFLSGFTLLGTMPREGRPPSAWTKTETRAVSTALLVITLLFAGVAMLLKSLFG